MGFDLCKGDPIEIKVDINPEPVFVAPTLATVCSDAIIGAVIPQDADAPLAARFDISKTVATGLTPKGTLATMGSGITYSSSYISNDTYENLTTGVLRVVYTVTPISAAGCKGDPIEIKVDIKPEPNPILTTTIQKCSSEPYTFDFDTYIQNNSTDLGQVTYTYSVVKVPNLLLLDPDPAGTGLTSSTGAITNSITNFGTNPITVRYTAIPTGANGCVGTQFIVNVVINPAPIVNIYPNGSDDPPVPICGAANSTRRCLPCWPWRAKPSPRSTLNRRRLQRGWRLWSPRTARQILPGCMPKPTSRPSAPRWTPPPSLRRRPRLT